MEWLTGFVYGLYALFHWRFVASVGASIAGALLLSKELVWFTAGWCVSLVVVGVVVGLLWQISSKDLAHPIWRTSGQPLSKPVEAFALVFIGLVLGAALASAFHSLVVAAFGPVAVVLAAAGLWTRLVCRRAMSLRETAFYAAWPFVGVLPLLFWVFANR